MKVYSASDITALLDIKDSTLRKYCLMLEDKGYEFQKNNRDHRFFRDDDIITLRKFITLKNNGMSLEESAEGVVLWHKGNEEEVTDVTVSQTDTRDVIERYNNDMTEMKDMMRQQNEIINELSAKIDKQQEYINDRLEQRDNNLMKVLEENLESQRQIASASEEKKGFWKKLFG